MSCTPATTPNLVHDFYTNGTIHDLDTHSPSSGELLTDVLQHELMMGTQPEPAPYRPLTAAEERAHQEAVDAIMASTYRNLPAIRTPPETGVRLRRQ